MILRSRVSSFSSQVGALSRWLVDCCTRKWGGCTIIRFVLSIVTLLLVLGELSRASATTYFVRASGDDSRDGLSPATAFASIGPAGRLLVNPGDRVIVGPGVYREGNITPGGSGTTDAPIVFLADSTGQLTHDPPGPVRIIPPNTESAGNGFIVRGGHDVVIEGFTVEGAARAGIKIRPDLETGTDSSAVTVRNNTLRGGKVGLQVTAAGAVTVVGNTVADSRGAGLRLSGGATAALAPFIGENTIERNRIGIGLERSVGGIVVHNALRANGESMVISESDALAITGNEVFGFCTEVSAARDVQMTDNVFERSVRITWLNGSLLFARNRFIDKGLEIYAGIARVAVQENQLRNALVRGEVDLVIERNQGLFLEIASTGTTVVSDNQFAARMAVTSPARMELSRNQAGQIIARGSDVALHDNV